MKCPIDGEVLIISERSGVEVDYCPKCRGVWLDRGELDKIIERSAQGVAAAPQRDLESNGRPQGHRRPSSKKKPESFLADLFDF